jgi:hypothetical protein
LTRNFQRGEICVKRRKELGYGSTHGMRNELYLPNKMALDRLSRYAYFFDAKIFADVLAAGTNPIREYRVVTGRRQALLALVTYSEGDDTALKSFLYAAGSSGRSPSSLLW